MSYFTDPMAALEEAEFIARDQKRTMYVVEIEPNHIEVMTSEEAYHADGIVLEKIVPFEKNHNIYD